MYITFLSAGEDFRNVSDVIIFAPQEQTRVYIVEIFDDEKVETRLETFFVVLNFLSDREQVSSIILGEATASIFIIDINSTSVHVNLQVLI